MPPYTYIVSCTGGQLGEGCGKGGEGVLRALADALEVVAGAETMGMTCAAGAPGGGGAAGAPVQPQAVRQQICSR